MISRRSWLPTPPGVRKAQMQTPVRCKRAMTFPERMLYGGGLQDEAVHLRLAHYPPVITCFRCCLGAHGSEQATAAGDARRRRPPHGGARRSRAACGSAPPAAGGCVRWE